MAASRNLSPIEADVAYPLSTFGEYSGLGRHAIAKAMQRGLVARKIGNRKYVIGSVNDSPEVWPDGSLGCCMCRAGETCTVDFMLWSSKAEEWLIATPPPHARVGHEYHRAKDFVLA